MEAYGSIVTCGAAGASHTSYRPIASFFSPMGAPPDYRKIGCNTNR
jgi:hypothetical protein